MASSARRASKSADVDVVVVDTLHMRPKNATSATVRAYDDGEGEGSKHGVPTYDGEAGEGGGARNGGDGEMGKAQGGYWSQLMSKRRGWGQYMRTWDFWGVLLLGWVIFPFFVLRRSFVMC